MIFIAALELFVQNDYTSRIWDFAKCYNLFRVFSYFKLLLFMIISSRFVACPVTPLYRSWSAIIYKIFFTVKFSIVIDRTFVPSRKNFSTDKKYLW